MTCKRCPDCNKNIVDEKYICDVVNVAFCSTPSWYLFIYSLDTFIEFVSEFVSGYYLLYIVYLQWKYF